MILNVHYTYNEAVVASGMVSDFHVVEVVEVRDGFVINEHNWYHLIQGEYFDRVMNAEMVWVNDDRGQTVYVIKSRYPTEG